MTLQLKRTATALGIILIAIFIAVDGPFAAPKKNATVKKGAAPKKAAAVKKKAEPAAGGIPRERVIREFLAVYRDQPGSKRIKVVHTDKVRYYREIRGQAEVPAQAHSLALTVKLTDCGITIRDIWEVYFYKLETAWIFADIMQVSSKQLTQTKKKHPPLDDAASKKLIAEALAKSTPGLEVREITVLGKKAMWRLCVPEYRVTSKISVALKNEIYNTATDYECLITSTLTHENGAWVHMKSGCMYKGKEIADCHIGTMCRDLGTSSTIPALDDATANSILKKAFEQEYGLRKNNVSVEKFDISARLPLENFGKKAPYTVIALFVIDENKEIPATKDSPRHTVKTRAVYECVVRGFCSYSLTNKRWEGVLESCCASAADSCGFPCSYPDKGCRRLGEK